MAWNEPGNKNPWDQQGPPDLEEVFRKFRRKFGGGGNNSGGGGEGGGLPKGLIAIVAGIGLVVWLFTGFYIVQPGERGVVLQFGKYLATTGEGPHWTGAVAEELGINVFYGGHYATETFGVKALATYLARKFRLPWEYLDHPTGL